MVLLLCLSAHLGGQLRMGKVCREEFQLRNGVFLGVLSPLVYCSVMGVSTNMRGKCVRVKIKRMSLFTVRGGKTNVVLIVYLQIAC